jgi:hypothetical protein
MFIDGSILAGTIQFGVQLKIDHWILVVDDSSHITLIIAVI